MTNTRSALSFIALLHCATALAATYQWDTNGATAGLGGTGFWNNSNANWDLVGTAPDDGTGATVGYAFTGADTAVFGGTSGSVTTGGAMTSLTLGTTLFNTPGYTLNLANAGTYNLGAIGGTVTNPTINVAVSTGATTTTSLGTTDWRNFTGTLNIGGITAAGTATTQAAGSGRAQLTGTANGLTAAATVNVNLNSTFWVGATTHAAALTLYGGDVGENHGQLRLDNGGVWSGAITLAGNMVGTDSHIGTASGTVTITGDIGETGGAKTLAIGVNQNSGTQVVLSGTNTYTGGTVVNGAVGNGGAGTLTLNYVTNNTGKLSDTAALTINKAQVRFVGNAGADTTELVGGLVVNGGANLHLDTAAGHLLTVDFTGASGTATGSYASGLYITTTGTGTAQVKLPGAGANAAMVAGVVYRDTFAGTDASGFITAGSVTNGTATDLGTWTSGAVQYLTTGSAFTGAVGSITIDGVTFKDAAARTVTIGTGETLTLTKGVIVTPDVANNASLITGGSIRGTAGGALTLFNADQQNTLEIQSVIADNAGSGLVKSGVGVAVLAAANTYTGGTIVNGGTLRVTGGAVGYTEGTSKALGTGAVTVNAGATLQNSVDRGVSGGMATDRVITLNGGTLMLSNEDYLYQATLNGGLVNGGSLWRVGSRAGAGTITTLGSDTTSTISAPIDMTFGHLTLNVADGAAASDLTITGTISQNTGGGSGAKNLIKTGAGTLTLTGSQNYTGALLVNGGSVLLTGGIRSASGATVTGAGSVLELGATNMFTGGHDVAVRDSFVLTADGGTLLFNGNFESRIGNVTLMNGATWTSNRTLSSWDALLGNTSAGAATIRVTNTGGNKQAATMNGTGGIHLQGMQNFVVDDVTGDAGADLLVSMELGAQGGAAGAAGGIVKSGAGTMAISRRASYTGGTIINEGVLALTGGGGASGTIRGTVTVNDGATLRLATGDATGYDANDASLRTINLNGGTLDINKGDGTNPGNQTLGGATINMTGGAITGVAGSNLDFFRGSSTINTLASDRTSVISGTTLTMRQTGGLTITTEDGAALIDLDISSVIRNSDPGALTKAGAGTMRLTGANTYNGGTVIQGGTLVTGHTAALGTGGVTLSGGTLQVGSGAAQTVALGAGAGITVTAAADVVLGFSSAQSQIVLNGGVYDFSNAGSVTLDLGNAFNQAGSYNLITGGGANRDFTGGYGFAGVDTANFGFSFANGVLSVSAIPEPSAYGLLGAGTVALVSLVRRRKRAAAARAA